MWIYWSFFCSKFYFKIYEVNLKVNKICWHSLVFNFLTLQCVTGKSDVKLTVVKYQTCNLQCSIYCVITTEWIENISFIVCKVKLTIHLTLLVPLIDNPWTYWPILLIDLLVGWMTGCLTVLILPDCNNRLADDWLTDTVDWLTSGLGYWFSYSIDTTQL